MTMNSSGPISLAGTTAGVSIEKENGGNGTTQISLNDSAVRTLAGVPSGAITMPTNFYGKANQFNYTISSNQTNFCMRAGAVSAGWNQSSKLAVTINSGVVLSANSTGAFGMYIQGSFPGGVSLKNNGTIVGVGGNGGAGCSLSGGGGGGAQAGPGLYIRSGITICNASGIIAGGGGGGGGGAFGYWSHGCCQCNYGGAGGGGGRSSAVANASGGSGGTVCGRTGPAGGTGTYSGAGGGGYSGGATANVKAGDGGNWGSAGGNGGGNYLYGGGAGGGGGAATCGTGYVTWTSTGTRYGAIN